MDGTGEGYGERQERDGREKERDIERDRREMEEQGKDMERGRREMEEHEWDVERGEGETDILCRVWMCGGARESYGGVVLPWRRVWNHGRLRFHVNEHACALPGVFTPAKD